jgi:hypothetical protein
VDKKSIFTFFLGVNRRRIAPARTRRKRIYPHKDAMKPYDKLASLADVDSCLRDGITLDSLKTQALALSDLNTARHGSQARQKLFHPVARDDVGSAHR